MQSRGFFLALVFGAVIFGVSGFLPSVYAAEISLNQINCEDYLGGNWLGSTCTIPDLVEAEIFYDEDLDEEDVLTIPGFTTLLIEEGGSLIISGAMFSEINSDIDNNGDITLEEESRLINHGSLINSGTVK